MDSQSKVVIFFTGSFGSLYLFIFIFIIMDISVA